MSTATVMLAWRSPWVIAWASGVLLVLSINLSMAYLAIKTQPGLVVANYYACGQAYEQHIFSRQARHPNWQLAITLPETLIAGQQTPLQFTILDQASVPIAADAVMFYAYRPNDMHRDFALPMTLIAPGLYQVKANFHFKGRWDLLVTAQVNGEEYSVGHAAWIVAPR